MSIEAAFTVCCAALTVIAVIWSALKDRHDAKLWRRFESAMDIKGSALILLEEFEQMKRDHDKWVDSYVRRGEQSIESALRLH